MVNGNGLWIPPGAEVGRKDLDPEILSRSVIDAHPDKPIPNGSANFVLWAMGPQSDGYPIWGTAPKARDRLLRALWPTESMLAGAIPTIAARNAAMDWKINAPEQTAKAAADMLRNANNGLGWESLVTQSSLDLYTQDNGAFVEWVKEDPNRPDSPTLMLQHLDSQRCWQTGVPQFPVIYEDADGKMHVLKWYQVYHLLEMPGPQQFASVGAFWRLQYSAVTRVLQYFKIMSGAAQMDEERLTGQFVRAVHLLSGITTEEVNDAMAKATVAAQNEGLVRYMQPVMVGSINPDAKVGHDTIPLASLPEEWSREELIKWYMICLSLGLLTDIQEFMPLPGGNLGTSSQSETLHLKSRGKGVGLFQQLWARMVNAALPEGVEFEWDETDIDADAVMATNAKTRAETRAAQITSGEITPEIARARALAMGDLSQEEFDALKQQEEQLRQEREQAARDALAQAQAAPQRNPVQRRGATPNESSVEGEEGDTSGVKASGPVKFGDLITSRLHRAYAMTADDASALGYFPNLDDRLSVASAIGPSLEVFSGLLREAGVFDIPVEADDADRIMEASFKALDPERAGPDEARLEFEGDVAEEIGGALARIRRELRRRAQVLAD
jgi:hypothetical protein